ncbi:MAG: hypothetical protein ABSE22_03945 [Xanthobacteraceae bacterium]
MSPWFDSSDHAGVNPRARRSSWARQNVDGKTSFRAIIASSAFLMLFAIAMLFGGHAAIEPLLRSAMAARDAKGIGDIVYAMPDGKLCRHMSFDNGTSEMVEGEMSPCPDNLAREKFRVHRGFAWGE